MAGNEGVITSLQPCKSYTMQERLCAGVNVGEAATVLSMHIFCCSNVGCFQTLVIKGAAKGV